MKNLSKVNAGQAKRILGGSEDDEIDDALKQFDNQDLEGGD